MPRTVRRQLVDVLQVLRAHVEPNRHPATKAALDALQVAFQDEFGPSAARPQRPYALRLKSATQKVWYQRRKRQAAEEELRTYKKSRVGGVLQLHWQVRIGLSPPQVPARTLAIVLAGILPGNTGQRVSATSVSRVRDAFVELLKVLSDEALGHMLGIAASGAHATTTTSGAPTASGVTIASITSREMAAASGAPTASTTSGGLAAASGAAKPHVALASSTFTTRPP